MRNQERFSIRLLVVMTVLAFVAAACGGGSAGTTVTAGVRDTTAPADQVGGDDAPRTTDGSDDGEMPTLRLGFTGIDFTNVDGLRWIQILEEDLGLTIEIVDLENSAERIRAMVADALDMALGTVAPTIILTQQGEKAPVVLTGALVGSTYVALTRTEFSSLDELATERIGISTPGDSSDSLTRAMFESIGVAPDDLNLVEIGGTSARIAALQAGDIALAPTHIPDAYAAIEASGGDLHTVAFYKDHLPESITRGLIANQAFVERHPELTEKIVHAYIDAARWSATNKEGFLQLAKEEIEGMSDEVMEQSYDTMRDLGVFAVNGMSREQLEKVVELELAAGNLEEPIPPMEEWAYLQYVDSYLEAFGEFEG